MIRILIFKVMLNDAFRTLYVILLVFDQFFTAQEITHILSKVI